MKGSQNSQGKRMATKANCIKGCQILAEITTPGATPTSFPGRPWERGWSNTKHIKAWSLWATEPRRQKDRGKRRDHRKFYCFGLSLRYKKGVQIRSRYMKGVPLWIEPPRGSSPYKGLLSTPLPRPHTHTHTPGERSNESHESLAIVTGLSW